MSSSFFFLGEEQNQRSSLLIKALRKYSGINKTQVYVLKKPLGENKYSYEYDGGIVILVPNHKIMILNTGDDEDAFEEYYEDFIEDLGSISDKYNYKEIVGRTRKWREELVYISEGKVDVDNISIKELLVENQLNIPDLKKKCELLISLLTGSINDIKRVKDNVPDNILDKVKQKILLFDGDQTRFVYSTPNSKRVVIQGLSGTGKTELLLHKLKEVYLGHPESKVLFTCHNKILASSLRGRIPHFFNFMKVEEQIEWNERLWCVHAWGSQSQPHSGAYRYICEKYQIPFRTFSYTMPFSKECELAISQISEEDIEKKGYAFNYVLIDESQDFPEEFISLCEKVTENNVYVAGDIFQSIFDENITETVNPNYLLSKCYRTDPRTLMFAHGVGMGLFEEKKLRWLKDEEWERCGYIVEKDGINYILKREPLRRFEDLAAQNFNSMELIKVQDNEDHLKVIETIKKITDEHPTVTANDIGIIFIGSKKWGFGLADILEVLVPQEFGWELNKAYDTKSRREGELFISNKNNVKGLEFPFVICVSEYISNARHERNALYMMLTRSFIQTYLIVNNKYLQNQLTNIEAGLACINQNGYMVVEEPQDKDSLQTTIDYSGGSMSVYELVDAIFDELDVPPLWRDPIYDLVKILPDEKANYENIKGLVVANMEKVMGY